MHLANAQQRSNIAPSTWQQIEFRFALTELDRMNALSNAHLFQKGQLPEVRGIAPRPPVPDKSRRGVAEL